MKMSNKLRLYVAILLLLACFHSIADNSSVNVQQKPLNLHKLFHHHIHNFYFIDWDQSNQDYLAMHRHANAMSYDGVTHYLTDKLPQAYDHLNRILLHNAYYIPMHVDFSEHKIKYSASYMIADNKSAVRKSKTVWKFSAIDSSDIDLIKGLACAKSSKTELLSTQSTFADAQRLFYIDKVYKRLIVNWQSKHVVGLLAQKTLETLQLGRYDTLFIDDIPRLVDDCKNKSYGGDGYYESWKAGQLAFLQKVKQGASTIKGYHQQPIKVFGNIWSPYADSKSAEWYATGALKLDHYYFESGGFAKEDLFHGQAANTTDQNTGLPAFKPLWGRGHIPANLISLSTNLETMNQLADSEYDEKKHHTYLQQHYQTAGVAASQGSWFGWYGETSVNKRYKNNQLIHTNLMQLLRAIPNWENITGTQLSDRHFNGKQTYKSPVAEFNQSFVKARNPINKEFYIVFNSKEVKIPLEKKVESAYFVNDYFEKTNNQATSCLTQKNHMLMLTCPNKTGRGIRITAVKGQL